MRHLASGILSLSLAITTVPSSAQELTPQQAGQYMAAAGEVLSAQKTMEAITRICGESAAQLSATWNDRNKSAIAKADKLRATVLRDIEKLKGTQTAKAFEENQNRLLTEKVAKSVQEVEILPPEKKKHICKRYVETANEGKWDISKNTGLYNFLMNAK